LECPFCLEVSAMKTNLRIIWSDKEGFFEPFLFRMASRVFLFFTPIDSSLVRNWAVCREPRTAVVKLVWEAFQHHPPLWPPFPVHTHSGSGSLAEDEAQRRGHAGRTCPRCCGPWACGRSILYTPSGGFNHGTDEWSNEPAFSITW